MIGEVPPPRHAGLTVSWTGQRPWGILRNKRAGWPNVELMWLTGRLEVVVGMGRAAWWTVPKPGGTIVLIDGAG